MDLSPYLDGLRRDLTAAAAPAGEEVRRAADLLAAALEPGARLALLDAISDAAAEITTRLDGATVDVRLRGRQADLVVTHHEPAGPAPSAPPAAPPAADAGGDLARITLRLPEPLKEQVERAATAEGVSVNAWLVRAVATALHGPVPPAPSGRHPRGRRITGFAQA